MMSLWRHWEGAEEVASQLPLSGPRAESAMCHVWCGLGLRRVDVISDADTMRIGIVSRPDLCDVVVYILFILDFPCRYCRNSVSRKLGGINYILCNQYDNFT